MRREVKAIEAARGRSPSTARQLHASALEQLEQVAPTDVDGALLGETGTGKEVIAAGDPRVSARRSRPFVRVDCGGHAGRLIESELFGHEQARSPAR